MQPGADHEREQARGADLHWLGESLRRAIRSACEGISETLELCHLKQKKHSRSSIVNYLMYQLLNYSPSLNFG